MKLLRLVRRCRVQRSAEAGTLGSTIEEILADLKPEAAYFFADDSGQRTGSIVFDMKDNLADSGNR